jgi:hypothetical protein
MTLNTAQLGPETPPAHDPARTDPPRLARWRAPLAGAPLLRLFVGRAWGLLLAVGLGILAAVVLVCTVPLYTGLVANDELQAALQRVGPGGRNIEIVVGGQPVTTPLYEQENGDVRGYGHQYLSQFTAPDVTTYFTSHDAPLAAVGPRQYAGAGPASPRIVLEAWDYQLAHTHMRLLAGAFPAPTQLGDAGLPEALVTAQMAANEGVQVGDVVVVNELAAGVAGPALTPVTVRVVGIWEQTQTTDPFWNGRTFISVPVKDTDPYIYPVLLDQSAFLTLVSGNAGFGVERYWIFYVAPSAVTLDNLDTVAQQVALFHTHVVGQMLALGSEAAVLTGLGALLGVVGAQAALQNLPLYMIVALIVCLVLLFVLAVAGALVESQASEIATLKSRGASGTQLLGSFLTQALLLAAIAASAGPWLAIALSQLLVHWFVPAVGANGANLAYLARAATPRRLATPAVGAALLGAGAVVVAAYTAARLDVLGWRREQGRSARVPFWQRTYLDVGLAVIAVLAYAELQQFGGLSTRQALGQPGTSPLLLAAPVLLLVAGTLLLLRVFPPLARLGMRLATRARGATGLLAFAQLARTPAAPSRIALLALAVGVGLFALTFDATVTHNAAARAAFQVGADLRVVQRFPAGAEADQRLRTTLGALPGVRGVAAAYRNQVTTTNQEGLANTDLLAIDPTTWAQVAGATAWQSTDAGVPLPTLMASLSAHEQLAADQAFASTLGDPDQPLWALVSQSFAASQHLRVGDHYALVIPTAEVVPTTIVVGAIVSAFPTLNPASDAAGFVVLGLDDYVGITFAGSRGPNEYWLATANDPAKYQALLRALDRQSANLEIDHVVDRRALEAAIASSPVQAGMRGLLAVGAVVAALLALLGGTLQASVAARQRARQFALMRTLGMSARQLVRLLLGEQVVVFAFGVVAGSLLGLLLVSTTLPFLELTDSTIAGGTPSLPPYALALDPPRVALFYLALVVVCLMALLLSARVAAAAGLGQALRVGED